MVSDDKTTTSRPSATKSIGAGRYKGFISSKLSIYAGLFLVAISLVAAGYKTPERNEVANAVPTTEVASAASVSQIDSVDQLDATKTAAYIATRVDLPIAANVESLSISLAIERDMAQNSDGKSIDKPLVIQADGADRGIKKYKTQSGDTIPEIAKRYGVSSNTIKWENNLTSDAIEPGKTLRILPVTGVLYTVRSGDTVSSIADDLKANESRIISFNNLELDSSLSPGQDIIVPGGTLPEQDRPGYEPPNTGFSLQYVPSYGGSGFGGKSWYIRTGTNGNNGGYAFGNCTAYAFSRRAELGKPVGRMWGNAATWAMFARAQGYTVNNTPAAGAVMQNGGGYGHVAIVEEVLPNGDVRISEMNAYVSGGGFNTVSGRIIPASSAQSYAYIH